MGTYLSPDVYRIENDVSPTVQETAVNYVAHIIRCPKMGPELKRVLITNEEDLISTFGEPTNVKMNYIDILSAQGALYRTSTLYCTAVRPEDATFAGVYSTEEIETISTEISASSALSNTDFINFSQLETEGIHSIKLNDFISKDPDYFSDEVFPVGPIDIIFHSRGSAGNRYRFAIVNNELYDKIIRKEIPFDYPWIQQLKAVDAIIDDNRDFIILLQKLPDDLEDLEKNWKFVDYYVVSSWEKAISEDTSRSKFVETVMNQSKYIRVALNENAKNKEWTYATKNWIRLNGGSDGSIEELTDANIMEACDLYKSTDDIDLGFFISAGKSENVINYMVEICKERWDSIVIADPPEDLVVNNKGSEVEALVAWRKGITPYEENNMNVSTDRLAIFANWLEVYDKWNKKYRWIPASGYVAAVFAYNDEVAEAWYAAAGLNRGVLPGSIRKLAYNPSKSERDLLYSNGLNIICSFVSQGKVVWGNKTMLSTTSSFSSINVRRLFDVIEKNILNEVKVYLFEPNDEYTRAQIVTAIEPYLRDVKSKRGIYEYLVICDSRNNTAERIDKKELWVDVLVKPVRSAEFIIVRFTNTSYGTSFDEITDSLGM